MVLILIQIFCLQFAQCQITKAIDPLGKDISGNMQVGSVGQRLKNPLVVSVKDSNGKPCSNVLITFNLLSEPSVSPQKGPYLSTEETRTDDYGYAMTYLTLGENAEKCYVVATSKEFGGSVYFTATALSKSLTVLTVLGIIGGLALFLFGLGFSSRGLKKAAGDKLREIVWNLTRNRFLGLIAGISGTAILQSSTAMTIMLVSFANAGLIFLKESLPVILGADIGTTITVQIIAFKVMDYAILMIAAGFALMSIVKQKPHKYIGQAILGFGFIFYGMKIMSDAVLPMKYSASFHSIISYLSGSPLSGILLALVITSVLHSSAATIGIALTLAFNGLIDLKGTIPLILGANIGTCVSALTISIGGNLESKKVAFAHTFFKIFAVILFFPFINQFAHLIELTASSLSRQIANGHTIFNLVAAAIFIPLIQPYSFFVKKIIPRKIGERKKFSSIYLDERVLDAPSLALATASREILRMADIVYNMLKNSLLVIKENDEELMKSIIAEDDKVDILDESITPYLTNLSQQELTEEHSKKEIMLLCIVDELEHIGDVVSKNFMSYAKKKIKFGFSFSREGFKEIENFHSKVLESLQIAIDAITTNDRELALKLQERRVEMNDLLRKLHRKHIDRLHRGLKESLETSTVHLDLITDLERINLHTCKVGDVLLGIF